MRALRAGAWGSVLLLALALTFQRVDDPDLPWHLAAGEQILATHAVPTIDTWSALSLGQPWLDVHWLAQVLLALVRRLGGFVLLQCLAFALTAAAIVAAVRAGREPPATLPVLAAPLATLALLCSQQRLDPRPDLVSHLFPALLLLLLDRLRAGAEEATTVRSPLAGLALLQATWTNLHGSFVLGPLTALAYLLGAASDSRAVRRVLVIAVAVVSGATLLNPRGATVWQLFGPYIEAVTARFGGAVASGGASAASIQEWLPPLSPGAARHLVGILVPYQALLGVAVLALGLGRTADLPRSAVLLLFAGLSLAANRNIGPFAFVALAVAPARLDRLLDRLPRSSVRRVAAAVTLLALGVTLALAFRFGTNRVFLDRMQYGGVGPGKDPIGYPEGACDYLQAAGLPGQAFHNYELGGYYIWRFAPERMAFADGRLDLLAPAELDRYIRAMQSPELFEEMARTHGVTHVLLRYIAADALLLFPHLEREKGAWRRVYADDAAVVYVRRGIEVPDVTPAPSREHPWDAAATRLFAPLARLQRTFPAALLNRAILAQVAGDLDAAAAGYREALAVFPEALPARVRLAAVELLRGDAQRARGELHWLEKHAPDDRAIPFLREGIADLERRGVHPPPAP